MTDRQPIADDMVGQRFGWLIVDGPSPRRTRRGSAYWRCLCRCGRVIEVIGHNLRSGNTVSCGCLRTLLPAAKRRLAEELQREQSGDWEGYTYPVADESHLIASLVAALRHGVPLSAMDFPGRYPFHPLPVGPRGVRGDGVIVRRGVDPRAADWKYHGYRPADD